MRATCVSATDSKSNRKTIHRALLHCCCSLCLDGRPAWVQWLELSFTLTWYVYVYTCVVGVRLTYKADYWLPDLTPTGEKRGTRLVFSHVNSIIPVDLRWLNMLCANYSVGIVFLIGLNCSVLNTTVLEKNHDSFISSCELLPAKTAPWLIFPCLKSKKIPEAKTMSVTTASEQKSDAHRIWTTNSRHDSWNPTHRPTWATQPTEYQSLCGLWLAG